MADRALLHRSKLHDFKNWLISQEHKILPIPSSSIYEVLRWKGNKGRAMPIIFESKSPEHYSCNDAAFHYVKQFINSTRDK